MQLKVGILHDKRIAFRLKGDFLFVPSGKRLNGSYEAIADGNKVIFEGERYDKLSFCAIKEAIFELKNVVIGKEFHWQQHRNQQFEGDLTLIAQDNTLWAINDIDIERYIYSVIASEMSATSFVELLKAHAVISRSWVLSSIANPQSHTKDQSFASAQKVIKWYERDAHLLFDVCADDHCQRYQGIPHDPKHTLCQVIEETKGEVLMADNQICDTRFAKCCGGHTEQFSGSWSDIDYPYLVAKTDHTTSRNIDLNNEAEARKFILSSPQSFCNTDDKTILSQVFNDYDQETKSFFRWRVDYSQEKLSSIIFRKSGIDFGTIIDLIPLTRGLSGRITLLRIVGHRRTLDVGKELEIRRWLSDSHLYSSAFVVDRDTEGGFILRGAGWGHGVGLCQVGAAVMASKGYNYKQILNHYYPNANCTVF